MSTKRHVSPQVTLLYSGNALVVEPTTDRVFNLLAPALTYQKSEYDASKRHGGSPYTFTDVECFTLDFRKRLSTCFGYLERITAVLEENGYEVLVREVVPRRPSPPHPEAFVPRFDLLAEFAKLRYRQGELLVRLASNRNGQFNAPPGFGKSKTVLFVCTMFPRARILVTADPVAVVKDVLYTELACGLPDVGIVGGGKRILGRRVMCATFDSLHHIDSNWPDMVLVDECFPAGTLVDDRPIETICVGDYVTAYCERDHSLVRRRVTRTFRRAPVGNLVEIVTGGRRVVATEGHPFYTERGWISAGEVTTDDRLLLHVRPDVYSDEEPEVEAWQESAGLLLDRLPCSGVRAQRTSEHHVGGEPTVGCSTYDVGQPVSPVGGPVEDLFDLASDGSPAVCTTRQRLRHDRLRTTTSGGDRPETDCRADRTAAEGRPTVALQDRSGRDVDSPGGRDRRRQSLSAEQTGGGPAQGGVLAWARVDRVTIHERAGADGSGRLCPDGLVYNLEVEGEHTYLANDVVVHNCHQAASDGASSRLVRFNYARMYGLSATTEMRSDGSDLVTEGLCGPVRFFMSYQEGLEHGLVGQIEVHWHSVRSQHNPCENRRDPVERERHGIWRHEKRNKLIVAVAREGRAENESVLVTCRTAEHLAHIKALCPEAILIHAEDDRSLRSTFHDWEGSLIPKQEPMTVERRDQLTTQLRNGAPGIYVITPILNIGFNASRLCRLVRAEGAGSAIQDTQVPGRVSRRNDEKSGGRVDDFLDEFDPRGYARKAASRRDNYHLHGWKQVFPQATVPPKRVRRAAKKGD